MKSGHKKPAEKSKKGVDDMGRITSGARYNYTSKTFMYFNAPEKYYSVKNEDWKKFINLLYTFGRKDPKAEAQEITNKYEQKCWTAYYIAKERGRNKYGLFELPWGWREFVLSEIEQLNK